MHFFFAPFQIFVHNNNRTVLSTELPKKLLRLLKINQTVKNYISNFDSIVVDLRKLQRGKIRAYEQLLDTLDINQKYATDRISRLNGKVYSSLMNSENVGSVERQKYFDILNKAIPNTISKICDLTRARQERARILVDELDNSALIANITRLLHEASLKQHRAASELVEIGRNITTDIKLIYTPAEKAIIAIDTDLKSRNGRRGNTAPTSK